MHITFIPQDRSKGIHHQPRSSVLSIRKGGDWARTTFPLTSHPVPMFQKRFYEKLNIVARHKNEFAELTRPLLFELLSREVFFMAIRGILQIVATRVLRVCTNSSCRNRNNDCCKWRTFQASAGTNLRDVELCLEGKHGMPPGIAYKEEAELEKMEEEINC